MIKVLPSSNPENEDNLIAYVKQLEDLGVEYLHCDVMDGRFVENKCLSYEVLENVRNNTRIQLDVHLMVQEPIKMVKNFMKLRPNIITTHIEAYKNINQFKNVSNKLRKKDILVGVSLKPNTSVCDIVDILKYVDLILIMSVEPGKSGQEFIENSIKKIKDVKSLCEGTDIIIEVDGGINLDNYKMIVSSGAEFLVIGNAFYKSENKKEFLISIDKHYKK